MTVRNVITVKLSQKFLELASKELEGDWVVIGGAVLLLLGIAERVTVDIDLAGPEEATQKDTIKLMKLAESLSLPPEAINQAGAFFLHKIPHWKKNIVEVKKTKSFSLSRPNTLLFLQLKLPRFSEADLEDCLKMIAFEPPNQEQKKEITGKIQRQIRANETPEEKRKRYEILLQAITKGQL